MLLDSAVSAQAIVDPKDAAESAGLRYVSDARPGIRRKKAGKGFTYIRADGSKLSESEVLKRIQALAIPPDWTDVWICPFDGPGREGPQAIPLSRTLPRGAGKH